jgi:hypothetical protein
VNAALLPGGADALAPALGFVQNYAAAPAK